jgi:hypothetical protein
VRTYRSDFGVIPIHENVPDELVPVYPNPELEALLEKAYSAGADLGGHRAYLEVHTEYNEDGEPCGSTYYLRIPFSGAMLFPVKHTDEVPPGHLSGKTV